MGIVCLLCIHLSLLLSIALAVAGVVLTIWVGMSPLRDLCTGPTLGGVTVTINGLNFRPSTTDNVDFVPVDDDGNAVGDPLPCRWLNLPRMTYTATQITCVSPAGQGSRFVVRVTIGRDVATSTTLWSYSPPLLTLLTPSTVSPQVWVRIHGRHQRKCSIANHVMMYACTESFFLVAGAVSTRCVWLCVCDCVCCFVALCGSGWRRRDNCRRQLRLTALCCERDDRRSRLHAAVVD